MKSTDMDILSALEGKLRDLAELVEGAGASMQDDGLPEEADFCLKMASISLQAAHTWTTKAYNVALDAYNEEHPEEPTGVLQ